MQYPAEGLIIKKFGARLKEVREKKNLSLRELAHLADMAHGSIHEIEKGNRNPLMTTVVILARALEVDPSILLEGI